MSAYPILEISDGTTTVDLLYTFRLNNWIPMLPEPKNGGIWQDNPYSHGRRMIYRRYGNIIDTFDLKLPGLDQDNIIANLQKLRLLLENATYFWTTEWTSNPVYLIAKGPRETNERYALIYDWRTPQDDNPFAQPFYSKRPLVNNFILAIEHGFWQDVIPGRSEAVSICTENSGLAISAGTFYVDNSRDDVQVSLPDGALTATSTKVRVSQLIGVGAVLNTDAGLRFANLTIPQGATILKAYITVMSKSNNWLPVNFNLQYAATDDVALFPNDGSGASFIALPWS